MEVECGRWDGVKEIAVVRKVEGMKASLVPSVGGGEELGAGMSIDGGRKGVLSEAGR